MFVYVCMFCRTPLYVEGEAPIQCEDHPNDPVDYVYITEDLQFPEENE